METHEDSVAAPAELHRPWIGQSRRMIADASSGRGDTLSQWSLLAMDFLDKLLRYDHQDRLTAREAMMPRRTHPCFRSKCSRFLCHIVTAMSIRRHLKSQVAVLILHTECTICQKDELAFYSFPLIARM